MEAGQEYRARCLSSDQGVPKGRDLRIKVSQMRRAAISIPSNIAEGFNRKHNAEYRQFLYVALGSCAELETHVEIAQDLTFITVVQRDELLEQLDHESKMVRSLIKRL